MKQDLIDKIASQSLVEIQFARTFKQSKTQNWHKNEAMYYGGVKRTLESRASVQLSRMQEFVHTLLSKIDNPLVFKFTKRKNSQRKRVNMLNALRQYDQHADSWDIKDIVGKKQGILCGRAVYSYYADSIDNRYEAHLEPIDVYDFLIDPSCGGIDIEQARYVGSYDVIFDKAELEAGAKEARFIKGTTQRLIDSGGNADQSSQEETNKLSRAENVVTTGKKEERSKDKFKFWRWFTTFEGERYYLLISNNGDCIRCDRMADVLPTSDVNKKGMWPYWTWAAFPDLTEFWTPSYCDYVRELLMAQDVAVNQMLDNAEAINKPQKVVNVTAIENLAEMKYRRDGMIRVKGDVDVNKVIQFVQTPSINTPIQLFNLLETILEKVSGVSAQTKGVEDVQGRVGIYRGNEAAAADRFGLLNKSYSFGYQRFAKLYEMGVRDNLVRKIAIEIKGAEGVSLVNVKRGDIFKKGDSFGVITEASNAELMASEQAKEAKNVYLTFQLQSGSKDINTKKAREMQAEIAGFTQQQIDELLDTSSYGNADQASEADADIEAILLGEEVKPHRKATNAYKQYIVDYLANHDRDLTMPEFEKLSDYILSLDDVIYRNEARNLKLEQTNALRLAELQPQQPTQSVQPIAPKLPVLE